MTTLKKLSMYLTLSAFVALLGLSLTSCSKRNPELETDYATKKASAETLIGQINAAMSTMKDDHAKWTAAVDEAAKKAPADSAKFNALRADLQKHMADGMAISTLEDSVKAYMNASPDKADEFKAADDKLGANFNDLSDKWKALQDAHTKLGQSVTTATAPEPAKEEKPAAKKASKSAPHGVPRKSAH